MSTEGIFPKINNDSDFADEMNNALRTLNKTFLAANRVSEASSAQGYGPNNWFYHFGTDTSATKTSLAYRSLTGTGQFTKGTAGTFTFVSPNVLLDSSAAYMLPIIDYDIYTVIDECDNSSLDATIFPTSTSCTEGTNGISVPNGGHLITKDLSGYKTFSFAYRTDLNAGGGGTTIVIKLTDGTSNSTIVTSTSDTNIRNNLNGECTVYVDWANKKAYVINSVYDDAVGPAGGAAYRTIKHVSTYVDLSGWTALKIDHANGISGSSSTFYYLRSGIATPTTTVVLSGSADAGSHYTTGMSGAPMMLGTAGSTLCVKLTGTVGSSEVVVIRGVAMAKLS